MQCLTLATDRWFVFTVLIEPFIIRGGGAKVFTWTNLSLIIPYYLCYPDLSVLITASSSQPKKYFIEIQGALPTNDLLQHLINVCKIHPSHPIHLNHTICIFTIFIQFTRLIDFNKFARFVQFAQLTQFSRCSQFT